MLGTNKMEDRGYKVMLEKQKYAGGEHGLTEKDIEEFQEAFKIVDEDNNGEISVKELG